MAVELDYMEYANDGLAQAAYVSSQVYSADRCSGGTILFSTEDATKPATRAFDNNSATCWLTVHLTLTGYIGYDFGDGNDKIITKVTLLRGTDASMIEARCPKDFTIQASSTGAWGGEEVTLKTVTNETTWAQAPAKEYTFANTTAYRYYRVDITANNGNGDYVGIGEVEMMDTILQCYSEDTIVEQGTYSLQCFANTDSINETLTRTVGPTIDLSGQPGFNIYIRALRTGSNIKIGIHDSGGVTTEVTPNILSANTWQEVSFDITGVADADKDAIDSIITTIVNADSDNTFYIDDMDGDVLNIEKERNIVYDSILELSKTRDVVYDSILGLSKTRDIVYNSVLELSRERSILYDSILELSRERNIVYDAILWIEQARNIVYDAILYIEMDRDILYDTVLELTQERDILYDLVELIERLEAPTGVWAKQAALTDLSVKQERPTGTWIKQPKPS